MAVLLQGADASGRAPVVARPGDAPTMLGDPAVQIIQLVEHPRQRALTSIGVARRT
jgi:hypothetical protein